jgi:NADH:ubiquinone oxidoreductase subunit 3 (subunit A)
MMMSTILYAPPLAFLIVLAAVMALFLLSNRCASPKRKDAGASQKAYACGEDFKGHMIQPDYSQFFPFAFFFTILHVVALVIATVPAEDLGTFAVAAVYVVGAVMGLVILLRK